MKMEDNVYLKSATGKTVLNKLLETVTEVVIWYRE
jgi:hypothetical protein